MCYVYVDELRYNNLYKLSNSHPVMQRLQRLSEEGKLDDVVCRVAVRKVSLGDFSLFSFAHLDDEALVTRLTEGLNESWGALST
jgi:hypothetical protein